MVKKVRRSNVKDGVLLPLGNGFSLVKGDHPNKIDDVDIGPNNKNGLSVNHGEILQQQGNTLRVFSAEPMFGGLSPTQLLYGGLAPDKVFAMQEQYKRANRIADDGTKYQDGGKINRNKQTWDTVLNDEQEIAFNDWYKNVSSKLKLSSNPNDYEHGYDYRGYWLENKDNNIDYSIKDFHFPDKYKKPTHETFSNESIYATEEYGINPKSVGYWKDNVFIPGSFNILMRNNNKNSLEKEGFYYKNDEQLSLRQRYAESTFNDKALNRWSKAAGAYQIMPHIHKAYVKATGNKGDLYDLEYNTAIRNWLMDDINKNAHIKDSRNSNRNRLIKTYAAYNWGSGNLGTLLRRLEKEGVDTFNSYDWVNRLPKETKDYVNFIIHGDNINDIKNNEKYKEALDSLRTKKEFGGRKKLQAGGDDNILMRIDSENNLIDSIQPSIVTAKLPAKFNGSQAAAARYAEGYKFGKKIAQQRDSATKQVVDKILPTNINKDLDDNLLGYTPIVGDILQGVQGVKDFNKGNYLKGTVGLGLLVAPNILEKPVKAAIKYGAYKIKDLSGYMLKSLMRNNPLEKQLSKTGTINIDNVKALINKGSNVEKSVVDKVLTSEQFAGKKAIDYNDFRKAVQDELIAYKINRDARYEEYGLDRLFADPAGGSAGWYFNVEPTTYTFSSPRILQGSGKHYSENTLGHSRTYTTKSEPDVLHVMESQSDWAQENVVNNRLKEIAKAEERYPGDFKARRERAINNAEKEIKDWENMIESGVNGVGEKLEPWQIENIRTDYLYNAKQRLNDLKAKYSDVTPQEKYLSDNYTTRQIQENLRIAATHGQTKMRYPTRETAAKIEGYPKREAYFDAQGNDITTSGQSMYTFGEKLDKELKDINDELKKLQEYDYRWDVKDKMNELFERKDNILKGESKLRPGITKKTVYDYEDILKRYTKFPEQYKKLYKNADVRIVSDRMGNTWYEVDVPKDYLNQEWKFKFGGQTNINSLGERPNAKYGKEMKNKRNKAERGGIQSIGGYNFPKPFIDKYGNTIGINGTISKLATPSVNTGLANPPKINSVGDLNTGGGLSATGMGLIGAGINSIGAIAGSLIQQNAINNLKAPVRQYTLLDPVKLKTKINIAPQIARMKEMRAKLQDAAIRTSGSSRDAYSRILAGHNNLLQSAMNLYGQQENIQTELINRDLLNQQQTRQANAKNVIDTVNYNNEASTELGNRKQIATSNNWTSALNTISGAWAGPNGFIDRENARRVKAGELYVQALANPTAAKLLYGDFDISTEKGRNLLKKDIWNSLNNYRLG